MLDVVVLGEDQQLRAFADFIHARSRDEAIQIAKDKLASLP